MYVHADQSRSQDKLIISTAIPRITDEFHSANDIGWYGTAYLLTNCAFLLVFGKIYTILHVKATFLTAVILFEVGSAICGAAPNSIAFIMGRAIAGLGAGGVQSGVVCFPFSLLKSIFRPPLFFLCAASSFLSNLLTPRSIRSSLSCTLFRCTNDPNTRVCLVPFLVSRQC